MCIESAVWHTCKLCGKNIKNLAKVYGGNGIYYTEVFQKHIEMEHPDMSLERYFSMMYERPLCKCGICNKFVTVAKRGARFYWNKYMCGRYPGSLEWSENAKQSRRGKNNPMFGKNPWNLNLTKSTSSSLMSTSNKLTGRKQTELARKNMSISAKKRTVHGHTGLKHSEFSKQKMRDSTLSRIKNGDFKQLKSKPHKEMASILNELDITYQEEYVIEHWSFDFRLENGLLIEVDGDYFHSNPKIYKNGPQTKTQKINHSRDLKKNSFCLKNNYELLRFWECDILSSPDMIKKEILCKLKK